MLSYERIINSSTKAFKKRHLILDEEKRQELVKQCEARLGHRDQTQFGLNVKNDFAIALYDACGTDAVARFESLRQSGCFITGCFRPSKSNTLIVSETIVMTIEKGPRRHDFNVEIEKKTNLLPHLGFTIKHYKA